MNAQPSGLGCRARRDVAASLQSPGIAAVQMSKVDAHSMTPERFHRDFVRTNTPVLITGAAAHFLDGAGSAWTPAGLLQTSHAGRLHAVAVNGRSRASDSMKSRCNLSAIFGHPGTGITLTARVNLRQLNSNSQSSSINPLQREYFGRVRRANPIQRDGFATCHGLFALKITVRGGVLPHSHMGTLNVLTAGAKRWVMVDPTAFGPNLTRQEFERDARRNQRLGQMTPVEQRYNSKAWFGDWASPPAVRLALPHRDFIQRAGDALFVPQYFSHATLDLCDVQLGAIFQGPCVDDGFSAFHNYACGTMYPDFDTPRCNVRHPAGHYEPPHTRTCRSLAPLSPAMGMGRRRGLVPS